MNNIKRAIARSGLDWRFLVTIADHIFFFFLDQEKEGKERRVRNGIVRRLYFLGRMWFRGDAELVVTRVLEFDWIRLRA